MKKLWIIPSIFFAVAAICGFLFWQEYNTAQSEISEYTKLQAQFTIPNDEITTAQINKLEVNGEIKPRINIDALKQENNEAVGWVRIEGTPINYPVVQAKDNTKYLNTSFKGEKSKTGAVFMDCNNSAQPLDKNTILYGHNMGIGRDDMFGSLLKYKDEGYFKAHSQIQFDTQNQAENYKIFAVLHLNVADTDFSYLTQNFKDETAFINWVLQAKKLSLYDTKVEVLQDSKILTLSTCDRTLYGRNGRFVVLGVNNVKL